MALPKKLYPVGIELAKKAEAWWKLKLQCVLPSKKKLYIVFGYRFPIEQLLSQKQGNYVTFMKMKYLPNYLAFCEPF